MVPSDRALATFYRLSIVTMSPTAAVWPQFPMKCFEVISSRISKTVKDETKPTIYH